MKCNLESILTLSIAAILLLLGTNALAESSTFTASATVRSGLSIICSKNLSFGLISLSAANVADSITVASADNSVASGTGAAGVTVAGGSNGACNVSNGNNMTATATLAVADAMASPGTFATTTLTQVGLFPGATGVPMLANVVLSKSTAIAASQTGGDTIFIGGVLTVPATFAHAAVPYARSIVLTVTD